MYTALLVAKMQAIMDTVVMKAMKYAATNHMITKCFMMLHAPALVILLPQYINAHAVRDVFITEYHQNLKYNGVQPNSNFL